MLLLSRKINDRLSSLWCKHCSKPLNRNDTMKMFTMPFSIRLKYEEKWNKNDFILGKDEKKKLIIQALNCSWSKYAFQGSPTWFLRGLKMALYLGETQFFRICLFSLRLCWEMSKCCLSNSKKELSDALGLEPFGIIQKVTHGSVAPGLETPGIYDYGLHCETANCVH